MDPALFFPERGEDAAEPKAVCRLCPVRTECLEHALRYREKQGVWGGTSDRDRRRIVRNRAQQRRRERYQGNVKT